MITVTLSKHEEMNNPIVSLGTEKMFLLPRSIPFWLVQPVQSYTATVSNDFGAHDIQTEIDHGSFYFEGYSFIGYEDTIGRLEWHAAERDPWLEKFEELLNSFPQVSHQVDSSRKYIY